MCFGDCESYLARISDLTYHPMALTNDDKPLVWLHGEVTSPPFSTEARRFAGFLLRQLQHGETVSMPHSRPMPSIGARCHELRVRDPLSRVTWRIVYRIDVDAIVIAAVFAKKTQATPKEIVIACKQRLALYDSASK
jgi:phage-related protein